MISFQQLNIWYVAIYLLTEELYDIIIVIVFRLIEYFCVMDESIEQLEKKLKKITRVSSRLPLLLKLSAVYHRTDGERALIHAQEALKISESSGNQRNIVESLQRIGDAHFFLAEYKQSIIIYEKALQICDALHDDILTSDTHSWMSMPLIATGQFQKALNTLESAFIVQKKYGLKAKMAFSSHKMGAVYLRLSDYKRALEHCKQSLDLLKEAPDLKQEAYTLATIAKIYEAMGKNENALNYLNSEWNIHKQRQDAYGESTALGNMGQVSAKMGDYHHSLKYMFEALTIQELQRNTVHQALSNSNISYVYLMLKDNEKASFYSERSLKLIQEKDNTHIKMVIMQQHGKVLNALGQYENALLFLNNALHYLDDNTRIINKRDILSEIVYSCEQLHLYEKAIEYYKQLTQTEIELIKKQTDNDLRALEARFEMEKTEREKELYRLKAEQLEKDFAMRTKEVTALGLQLVQKNEFLQLLRRQTKELASTSTQSGKSMRFLVKQIEKSLEATNTQDIFNESLQQLHTDFQMELKKLFPSLTKTEIKICSLIKMNMSSNEIANLLFISIRTIEWHRANIRKKLKLSDHKEILEALHDLPHTVLQ